jgi:shikimate dehydrogenase
VPPEPLGLLITRRAAVLGRPIAHSLSPVLHRAAYRALGLSWTFTAVEIGTGELAEFLASRGPEWVGLACTMPLKREALSLASEVRPRATAVGAANTLLHRSDGGWSADNTDVAGIAEALRECGARPATATVLGAGGTAQAAVVALAELGFARCTVHVRDVTRTADVRSAGQRAGIDVEVRPLGDTLGRLVISTLPPGAADPLAARNWHAESVVLDVAYVPWPTPLGAAVAAAGGTVIGGTLVLLHQAALQVRLMTGRPAPVEAMRAALREKVPDA